jgi:MFS family permease
MNSQCSDDIQRIANRLGFSCEHAAPVVHIRNPFHLANWTLPVLELTVVAGAVLALWWAIRRLRRDGDPVNLVIWFSTVIYLLIVEPPLYFPTVFGVDDTIGAVFAHNVFTVEFMYDRLPLYIVALYPAMMMLAYEIVRSLGVFRDRGAVIGAVCVGFVHHCFYEIFDQLGPQLRWWAWNTDNAINRPMLASVPMSSVLLFATVGPALVALFTQLLVARPHTRGHAMSPTALVLSTFGVAALIPVGLVIANLPILLAGVHHPDGPLRWVVYVVFLALFTVVALPVLLRQWRTAARMPGTPNEFVRIFGPMFLVVIGALRLTALPANLNATGGITSDGTPTGNAAYAAACFLFAVAVTIPVSIHARTATEPAEVPAGDSRTIRAR